MADIAKSTDLRDISPLPDAKIRDYVAGGAGALGDTVYISAAARVVALADASVAGTAKARGVVVAIGGGKTAFVSGDVLSVAVEGPVTGFTGMTAQDTLYQSDTAGALADAAGTVSHIMGYAEDANTVYLQPAS